MNFKQILFFLVLTLLSSHLNAISSVANDYNLAFREYQQGQYAHAVSDFEKVIQKDSNSWQSYQGLGAAFQKLGDKVGAIQACKKSLEINPNNPPLKIALMNLESASVTPLELDTLSKEPFFDDFNNIDSKLWIKQNYTWDDSESYQSPSQVITLDSILNILVTPISQPIQGRSCLAGGLMSERLFTYGRFSAKIKNKLVSGLDNCFFLMSPWKQTGWHHQELDFEFLGKNPKQVQVNVHKYIDRSGTPENGGMLPKIIDLGFDSNIDFHVYTIEWQKDRIIFFVDNKLVWTETHNLPDRGLNMFEESFVVKQDNGWGPQWAGQFDSKSLPANVQFDWVKYDPE